MIEVLAEFEDKNGIECISISKKQFKVAVKKLKESLIDHMQEQLYNHSDIPPLIKIINRVFETK